MRPRSFILPRSHPSTRTDAWPHGPTLAEGLTLTGAVRSTYLRGKQVYNRDSGFKGVESEFEGKTLL